MHRLQFTPAVFTLLLMNLIPLIGVMKFGWDAGTIVFLYWLENVVIGLLNIPKILACRGDRDSRKPGKRPVFLAVFFSLHYGGFCLGHYIFLRTTFPELPAFAEMFGALTGSLFIWSLLGLAASHGLLRDVRRSSAIAHAASFFRSVKIPALLCNSPFLTPRFGPYVDSAYSKFRRHRPVRS